MVRYLIAAFFARTEEAQEREEILFEMRDAAQELRLCVRELRRLGYKTKLIIRGDDLVEWVEG